MTSTRAALLRESEALLRTRGYSAFSYADLANALSIRKATIHHHFPTKENLGITLIDDYLERFSDSLAKIEAADTNAVTKLRAYAQLFAESVEAYQLPLCGALAAESASLPESMRGKTRDFFELHLQWLTRVIGGGVAEGSLRASAEANGAFLILSVLEGASLVVWVCKDPAPLEQAFETVLASLCSAEP